MMRWDMMKGRKKGFWSLKTDLDSFKPAVFIFSLRHFLFPWMMEFQTSWVPILSVPSRNFLRDFPGDFYNAKSFLCTLTIRRDLSPNTFHTNLTTFTKLTLNTVYNLVKYPINFRWKRHQKRIYLARWFQLKSANSDRTILIRNRLRIGQLREISLNFLQFQLNLQDVTQNFYSRRPRRAISVTDNLKYLPRQK